MSYIRFTLDLAIKQPIPAALSAKLPIIKAAVRELKGFAEKINAGKVDEEMTVKATYHICRHDEGKPCGPEIEV